VSPHNSQLLHAAATVKLETQKIINMAKDLFYKGNNQLKNIQAKTCAVCTSTRPTNQSSKVSLKLHKWYKRSSPGKLEKQDPVETGDAPQIGFVHMKVYLL
jgi:hypothetical protein